MFGINIDKLRYQTRFVALVEYRDTPKRLALLSLMAGLTAWLGMTTYATWFVSLFVVVEIIANITYRLMPDREEAITPNLMFSLWFLNLASTIIYLSPALVLAAQPSTALLLAGFLWIFGIFVHITNSFAAMPLYNWTLMTPAFAAAFGVFFLASRNEFLPATRDEWIITSGLMCVYVLNTVQTLHRQKDTQKALYAARDEANARLRALEHLAQHDPLTGLFNRTAFDNELSKMLRRSRKMRDTTVMIIDLDGFKPINDTYSHDAGDQVLFAVGQRLRRLSGEHGIAARMGGDEFAMAFSNLNSERAAMRLAEYIARELEEPVAVEDKELRIGASIGVAMTRYTGVRVEHLCAGADQAMYRAKGRSEDNRHSVLYRPEDFEKRATLEDRKVILAALAAGEIRPHYQPKVEFATGRIYGFEALARWLHPVDGLLMPGRFLPAINELGLQADFLLNMTQQVLRDIDQLVEDGFDPGDVSINVPEMALATHSGLHDLDALLNRHPRARGHVTLEITEDVFFARSADMIRNSISHFRDSGLRVSLDDFGTGFASFQHLRELEFDELKIDTSFVADLGQDRRTEILVGGFLSMAEGLGVTVIAEGVEDQNQMAHLSFLGCKIGQGFLFGGALPINQVRHRLICERNGKIWHESEPSEPQFSFIMPERAAQ